MNYLLTCKSLTYAQKAQKVLKNAGIEASVSRVPRDVSTKGCAYCLRLEENRLYKALELLNNNQLSPTKIFAWYGGRYTEV